MKLKLDKLVYRNVRREPIDDSVLNKARRAMASDQLNKAVEQESNRRPNRKNVRKVWIGLASAAACIAISLSVALPLALTNKEPVTKNSLYCYEGDYIQKNYESVEKYNSENGTNLFYFTTDREHEKNTSVYQYQNASALLSERIVFLDTYEEIFLYVGRKEYDFEFLKLFSDLPETATIGGRAIRFESVFDESSYLYQTRADWTEGDYHYRIFFKLLQPDAWQDWLQTLFQR